MFVVVHVHVCLCVSPHVNTRPPGGSSSILVMLLLIGGHLIPPVKVLLKQRQHPALPTDELRELLSGTLLSFLKTPSPASEGKSPHLYFIPSKPTSPRTIGIVLAFSSLNHSVSATGFSLCSETCRPGGGKAFSLAVHSDFRAHFNNNWHEQWETTQSKSLTSVSFFSFFVSFREGALRCLLCSGRQGKPFCLRKSQWGRSWEAPFKTFSHHSLAK